MYATVRRLALTIAISLCVGYGLGCAGAQNTSDGEADVEGQPPEKQPSEELPEGPEVKVRSDYPEQADGSGSSEAERTASAGSSDDEASDKQSGTSEASSAETITEAERERLLEMGPSYIFQIVQLEPTRKDGEFRGYEIVDASAKAKNVMKPQLEVGDVVTHVNDIRIERPRDYMKAWNAFGDADRVHIDLWRDGEKETAVWVIRSEK